MSQTKRQYAGSLREHQEVSDLFQVLQKSLAMGRTNKPYLRVTLGDRTGQMEARVWDGAVELEARFSKGDIVRAHGRVTSYQGVLQLNVERLEPLPEQDQGQICWAEFLPAAARPAEEMWTELRQFLTDVKNPFLSDLLASFAADAEFRQSFLACPAAKGMHHVYVGGLLEHTLGVVRLAHCVGALYPVNRDLLVTGAFLHDIGKTAELTYRTGFDYTDEGRFLGHIVIGTRMVRERAEAIPGFPAALLLHLEHLILSHHGEYEWGSPKRPKTLEALVLHALDDLDAKLCGAREWMAKAEGADGDWTGYWKALGRYLYRPPLSGEAFGDGAITGETDFLRLEEEGTETPGRRGGNGSSAAAPNAAEPRQRNRKPLPGQGDLGL
ncbi:MAG: HD domain-containing protein [Deltaproteobacteria bacterium]|nr:HD domain-containing protein [Deltaproteobacteria bacterium]